MRKNNIIGIFTALLVLVGIASCDDNKSYADYLTEEKKAVNAFLADQIVINEIPADSVFEYGENAPYYKMTEEGDVFMQVIDPGTKSNKAQDNQQIYFRFERASLLGYTSIDNLYFEGNADDMSFVPVSFRFNNYDLESTTQYGYGIQIPLYYLGIDCKVNVVIKSQYGISSEISDVTPYLYKLRYFKSQI